MEALLVGVPVLITLLAIFQAVLVAVQTWEHRRFARGRLAYVSRCRSKGRALLIVPCRGNEAGLEENLRSVLRQDYENYEVRFVVESGHDPACPVIRRAMAAHPETEARVIVAGQAARCGQKVHNLLAATEDLPYVEYLAFADSDARLRPEWLRALVSHLDEPGVAAATGYRWFVPAEPSVAAHAVYSLNACVAICLGKHPPTVVWGGSWAIRRERFESLDLRGAWAGMLDEDLVAGRVFHKARLRVAFEPACMVASPLEGRWGDLFSFARRQYQLTRSYSRLAWRLIFLLLTLANLAFWGNLAATGWALSTGRLAAWVPATFALILYLLSVAAGYLRQDTAAVYFPHLRRRLRKVRRFEVWSGPLVFLINWLVIASSAVGREVRWRNIVYRLDRDGRVAVVRRSEMPRPGPRWGRREGPAAWTAPPPTSYSGEPAADLAEPAAM